MLLSYVRWEPDTNNGGTGIEGRYGAQNCTAIFAGEAGEVHMSFDAVRKGSRISGENSEAYKHAMRDAGMKP